MSKGTWALIALVYLAFAEVLSWTPVPDLSLCLIQPEHSEQTSDHDNSKYCPAFHTGIVAAINALDGILERHDKSVVGGFTIVLAISTIGLWLATNKLWVAGEKQFGLLAETAIAQSRDMQDSIASAVAAANAARHSNEIAQDTAERELRAYVSIAGVARVNDPGDVEGPGFAVLVDVKNDGKTPAYDVFQWAKIEVREFPLRERFGFHCVENPSLSIIPTSGKTMAFPTFKRQLTPLEEQAIFENGKAIYVYGEVAYRDIFGKGRLTQFRFRCNGQGYPLGIFKGDGEGNDAD